VPSGSASAPIPLDIDYNSVYVTVYASDGNSMLQYSIYFYRNGPTDANLSSLTVSNGSLTPVFSPDTIKYTDSVANSVTSITVTPTADLSSSEIYAGGAVVASGTASPPIALAVGANAIGIDIFTEGDAASKFYTINVVRASGSDDSFNPAIGVTKPAETPNLADDGILVHQAVSPNGDGINDFLQIDNIAKYPENKLLIMNQSGQMIYQATGYDNTSKVFDGHSSKNGKMQLPGTYFYQLDYTVKGITKHKTGYLVLKY